ncbi:hypothetical protein TVAG_469100 [Trichomonas vaginalis G3]|uniref:Uncharacterized protein n=1 Tax=Trichomonas vaginalis (strain ATCC PRA-98 / G3) TaxID=412133 RepID=A2FD78_TRIV3|nr:spectrin binding [Trichomonas vaginalis G3]XP_001310066.1 spectrin binding [Trichomonas vaginalis G3]EAX97134.1 hypothetical protein TVAG_469080 [Trichomonas vaginalis G3]EAX97136.1 hypothetical protein TVAG_469100 [Trichomonas vaginalis G3]KAI5549239.1 spectrin binding [Trichomonas vaginalis G3]KAI5549241.1 spectrin binding [Trichomonas vaginalis G3]|eukprot:XP_001310064.1 hypothetical protein [Trichomonas vaginalis G3]
MSADTSQTNEYIVSNIREYMQKGNFFDLFQGRNVNEIFEAGYLKIEDYIDLIEQAANSKNAYESIFYLLNANVTINSIHDANLISKAYAQHCNLKIFNFLSNTLDQSEENVREIPLPIEQNEQQKAQILDREEKIFAHKFPTKIE